MKQYNPGDKAVFTTTHSDMMNFNGRECEIVEVNDNGSYRVKFSDPTAIAFSDELSDN